MSALQTQQRPQSMITKPATPAAGGLWHRIRMTVQEMNYAARRVVELQAPWIVDQPAERR